MEERTLRVVRSEPYIFTSDRGETHKQQIQMQITEWDGVFAKCEILNQPTLTIFPNIAKLLVARDFLTNIINEYTTKKEK